MRIAFLGLGIMGRPMAANLIKAGHQVTTWNRTPGKEPAGAQPAQTAAEAVRDAEVVWICVSDTTAVEQVLFGSEGAAPNLRRGTTVVDSSTIAPAATLRFAERLEKQGVELIDAPVTGSKIGAENGTLIFIAGGKPETLHRLQPLFLSMGRQVFRMGEVGKGEAAKLAMNLQIALIYEGFAEALALARRLGVEQTALFDLIRASMVRSGVIDYKMPFVEKEDYSANFPLRLMLKDIRLTLEAAAGAGIELPGLTAVKRIYDRAAAAGAADLDYAATLRVVEGRM